MCCDGLGIHDYVKMSLPEEMQSNVDPTLFQQKENGAASSGINNTQNPGPWHGGPSMGTLIAGGETVVAAAHGAHHLSHGGHHFSHGGHHLSHGHHHGKFKHGKFKHGKFGKHKKHGKHHVGKFLKFKKWK
ncbi:unnamed protein product [Camellia sinensis]